MVDGRAAYPLLQFDLAAHRIYPAMRHLLAMKPDHISGLRLLYWLVRPHLDFDDTPGAALGSKPEAVTAAFAREIEPQTHG